MPVSAGLIAIVIMTLAAGALSSCSEEDLKAPTLREVYAPYFVIGAAIGAGERRREKSKQGFGSLETYPEGVLQEFSSLTPENAMKPLYIRHQIGEWSWAPADKIVDYAEAHGIRVRGHTLVWYRHAPEWMFAPRGSQQARKAFARERLRNHIHTLMGRYKGVVTSWDVVNEAICPRDCNGATYRTGSPWR